MSMDLTITRLSITPVKGLSLHHPEAIDLTRQGAAGDRLFYLVDDAGKLQSCTRNPGLYALSAAYDTEGRRLEITRGDDVLLGGVIESTTPVETDMWGLHTISSDVVADPAWSELFSDLIGRRVRLLLARGAAHDVQPVTLLGVASVEELARQAGIPERRLSSLPHADRVLGGEAHSRTPGTARCWRSVTRSYAAAVRCSAAQPPPATRTPEPWTSRLSG